MNEKKIVLEAAKRMYSEKLVSGTSGNVSLRNMSGKSDSFFITPSSISYIKMKEEDIVEMNIAGEPIKEGQIASSEWQMHLEIYKKYPHINAIIHTHSPYATAFAVNHQEIPMIVVEMRPYLGGDVKVVPFEEAGSFELGERILPFLEDRNACLLANHGTISCGKDMDDAYEVCEYLEEAARIYYYAKTLGNPVIL